MGVWDVMRSQNTQLKNPSVPNGGLYWYIIGRPNGVKKRAWFSTRAKAQAEATERNIKLRRLGQDSAKVDNSIIVMAVEGATELAPKTRMKIFGYIRNAYGIAVQKGLLETHPFEKVESAWWVTVKDGKRSPYEIQNQFPSLKVHDRLAGSPPCHAKGGGDLTR
jgi:hypothetical protein